MASGIPSDSPDHGAGGRQLHQVFADCSRGHPVVPCSQPLPLAAVRPERYPWSSPRSACLLPVRDMWHFRPLLSWNKVIFPEEPTVEFKGVYLRGGV